MTKMATINKYQTSSGAMLYRVRFRTPGRGQTDKRGFKTKRDAEAFANTVEVTKARAEYIARRWAASRWGSWARRGWNANGAI
jgi:hypothetical protein